VTGADGTVPVNTYIRRCFFRQHRGHNKLLAYNILLKKRFSNTGDKIS
jgi:hypothetical protein